MVHIAASLLWPDLPFLVTSPEYVLGAQATINELRRCLGYSSALNLFTTSHSLAGSDVLLHLPPPCKFSSHSSSALPSCPEQSPPPLHDFRYNTPEDVLHLIETVTASQIGRSPTRTRSGSCSVDSDLFYALFCTPYYGYNPTSTVDFLVMVYQLSSFIVYCCYTTGGSLNNLNCTPADLLSVLSTAYKPWTSLHPGEGVFICPLTDERVSLCPFPISWLYQVETAAPPPPIFGQLSDAFSAGNERFSSPLFDGPINLGPAASLHLNPVLLDPPHLDHSPLFSNSVPVFRILAGGHTVPS